MSYLVICTFDLKNANREDYQNAYADLEKIGLKRIIVYGQGSKYVIPTTTTSGKFEGTSATAVCGGVIEKVKSAFTARRFSSEIFLVASGDWAWQGATT